MIRCGNLRELIDVYRLVSKLDTDDETDYVPQFVCRTWANVAPSGGQTETLPGDSERAVITHRVTLRDRAIPELSTDMIFVCRGQRLQVQYFYPIYKFRGWVEVYCRMLEGDDNGERWILRGC